MDYKKNKKYFAQKGINKAVIIIGIIGILLCFANLLLGLVVIACVAAYIYFNRRPSDAEIDAAVQEEFKTLKAAALKKLGLDEEEIAITDPLQTFGYSFHDNNGRMKLTDENISNAFFIKGKDSKWRSPVVGMYFFGFAENEIHYYYRYTSLVSDSVREGTNVINYKDVTSVRSDTEILPAINLKTGVEDPKEKVKYDYFMVSVAGDQISCSVTDCNVADDVVNALRALIKQKKNA